MAFAADQGRSLGLGAICVEESSPEGDVTTTFVSLLSDEVGQISTPVGDASSLQLSIQGDQKKKRTFKLNKHK